MSTQIFIQTPDGKSTVVQISSPTTMLVSELTKGTKLTLSKGGKP